MIIDKRPINYNYSKRNQQVRYIVVHDTGNPSYGADALAHYRYFNGGNRSASAHYFVDDKMVVETVEVAKSAWHCGDGRGKYGIYNYNSIGVELCINKDSNWDKTKENALNLIRFLCESYNIPKSRVVRHYDASRKICPRRMSDDNWKEWWIFREMI
jgi:N-acetylmuramoyl-L-alanine amidase